MYKNKPVLENDTYKIIRDFKDINGSYRVLINKKKKRTCHLIDFAVEMKELVIL